MHDAYMDANIMEAIRAWLEPLPDRSLPSLDIQRAMFKILDEVSRMQ
jgi:transcription factor SPN1